MQRKISAKYILILLSLFIETAFSQTPVTLSTSTFGSMNARQIGPAVMSGRITAIDAVNTDSRIIYVGAADGGIWKSITGGTLFKPIFDKNTQSIGAITVDQKNPDIVWVGTGESNMRNSVSIGTGLYKTMDGGDSWQKVGLDNTEHISKIVIDPTDDKTVYVAAPGPLWSDGEDRGLYKTIDGGETWEKILYIDNKTGCADIILDPKNPTTVYASMWEFRRKPWAFSSGGPGSGLYKSIDGGRSWNRIDKDFAEGELGRICLAISPSDPNIIYAVAESKKPDCSNLPMAVLPGLRTPLQQTLLHGHFTSAFFKLIRPTQKESTGRHIHYRSAMTEASHSVKLRSRVDGFTRTIMHSG